MRRRGHPRWGLCPTALSAGAQTRAMCPRASHQPAAILPALAPACSCRDGPEEVQSLPFKAELTSGGGLCSGDSLGTSLERSPAAPDCPYSPGPPELLPENICNAPAPKSSALPGHTGLRLGLSSQQELKICKRLGT